MIKFTELDVLKTIKNENDKQKFLMFMSTQRKKEGVYLLLLLAFGWLGLHRFYTGEPAIAILYVLLFTTSSFIIPAIILFVCLIYDLFRYKYILDKVNVEIASSIAMQIKEV